MTLIDVDTFEKENASKWEINGRENYYYSVDYLLNLCEVKAIPIEWVKRWAMKSENTYNREQIIEMLNDWEKERNAGN